MARLTSVPLALVVLAAALLGAPAAQAALTDDVGAVRSNVESTAEAVTKALPDLPAPVETPEVPKVPEPVPPPSASKPPPPVPSSSAPDAAVRDLEKGAEEAVTPVPPEAEGVVPYPKSEPGIRAVTREPEGRSMGPSEATPARRWRAWVWPAIALRVGDFLSPLLARLEGFVEVPMPDSFGPLSSPTVAGSVGVAGPSRAPDPPARELRSSPGVGLSEEGMSLLATLLIGLLMAVGLVALARLVVGEDLFEARYWRGHRG